MSSSSVTDLSQLTTKQRYWYDHLERARDSETSLAAYAREQNLDIKALYHYQSVLRQKGVIKTVSRFSRVTRVTRVTHASIIEPQRVSNEPIIIHLRNGHRLELPADLVDLNTLFQTVQSL